MTGVPSFYRWSTTIGESPCCCLEPRARRAWRAGGGEQVAGTQGALRVELFDCVPLDVLMPERDGYQVLEHVRRTSHALAHAGDHGLGAQVVETLNAGSLFDKLTGRQALPGTPRS
jgi:CheY-like chemotaxis protein